MLTHDLGKLCHQLCEFILQPLLAVLVTQAFLLFLVQPGTHPPGVFANAFLST